MDRAARCMRELYPNARARAASWIICFGVARCSHFGLYIDQVLDEAAKWEKLYQDIIVKQR